MPSDPTATVVPGAFVPRTGEQPVTLFLDAEAAHRVEVLYSPPTERADLRDALVQFASTCYQDHPDAPGNHVRAPLGDIVNGSALWQCMELLDFVVSIGGIDRTLSHQIVRQRIGVTFSHQCTGDRDCRHDDVLIPRAFADDPVAAWEFAEAAQLCKVRYSAWVDGKRGFSIQEARRILPHAISNHIRVRWNLAGLSTFVRNRGEPVLQDWLTFRLAIAVREAVVHSAPWSAPVLALPRVGSTFFDRTRDKPGSISNLFCPKGTPWDDRPYNPASYFHGERSHFEVSSGPEPVPPRVFRGSLEVARGVEECRAWLESAGRLEASQRVVRAYSAAR